MPILSPDDLTKLTETLGKVPTVRVLMWAGLVFAAAAMAHVFGWDVAVWTWWTAK